MHNASHYGVVVNVTRKSLAGSLQTHTRKYHVMFDDELSVLQYALVK